MYEGKLVRLASASRPPQTASCSAGLLFEISRRNVPASPVPSCCLPPCTGQGMAKQGAASSGSQRFVLQKEGQCWGMLKKPWHGAAKGCSRWSPGDATSPPTTEFPRLDPGCPVLITSPPRLLSLHKMAPQAPSLPLPKTWCSRVLCRAVLCSVVPGCQRLYISALFMLILCNHFLLQNLLAAR